MTGFMVMLADPILIAYLNHLLHPAKQILESSPENAHYGVILRGCLLPLNPLCLLLMHKGYRDD